MIFDIRDYGAKGDGRTLNTENIQSAIDSCFAAGGGKVLITDGIYMTGTIILKSNVNLHIESNAVLLGSPDCADYPERKDVRHVDSKLLPRWRNACLIYAEESENIVLSGMGKIDCNGHNFVHKVPECGKGWSYVRFFDRPTPPRAVFFAGCRNCKFEDITMVNQPAGWSYWVTNCDYVSFDRIKIIADVNYPNNDGIHINSSRNVTVSNCSITCGDDCIVVRANNVALKENKVCERVTVTNCNLTSYSGAIRIGWLNDGTIRNCTFSNLVMTDCTVGIDISLPFMKPDPNSPNTSDIGREDTLVENLTFSNIIMDKLASNPIKITVHSDEFVRLCGIRNIYFNGIHSKGPAMPKLIGKKERPLDTISFNDCTFTVTDGSEHEDLAHHGAVYHINPGEYYPMHIQHVDNLRLNNVAFNIK